MTGMAVTLFVLAGLLVAMACLRATWINAVRRRTYPAGGDLSTGTFVAARAALLLMAALGIWQGAKMLALDADSRWSDAELTSATRQTVTDLDGYWYRNDTGSGESPYFTDYATLITTKLVAHGGGGAPQTGVDAVPESGDPKADGAFTIRAEGATQPFCLTLRTKRWKARDYTAPGIGGRPGVYKELGYRLTVRSTSGAC
jgi:hypothetical protein